MDNCPTCGEAVDSIFDHVDKDCGADEEMTPEAYLQDLAQRLLAVLVMYGVDQSDFDRLNEIAEEMKP